MHAGTDRRLPRLPCLAPPQAWRPPTCSTSRTPTPLVAYFPTSSCCTAPPDRWSSQCGAQVGRRRGACGEAPLHPLAPGAMWLLVFWTLGTLLGLQRCRRLEGGRMLQCQTSLLLIPLSVKTFNGCRVPLLRCCWSAACLSPPLLLRSEHGGPGHRSALHTSGCSRLAAGLGAAGATRRRPGTGAQLMLWRRRAGCAYPSRLVAVWALPRGRK